MAKGQTRHPNYLFKIENVSRFYFSFFRPLNFIKINYLINFRFWPEEEIIKLRNVVILIK
jgi:hypothetical protein